MAEKTMAEKIGYQPLPLLCLHCIQCKFWTQNSQFR